MLTKVPNLLKKLYPKRIWDVPGAANQLFLTFDDGPVPEVTPWVLDQLDRYHAKATFFCIGDNIRKNPQVFQQVISRGHAIGNHTFNHLNGWNTTVDDYVANTLLAQNILNVEVQRDVKKLFRPPYGRLKGRQAGVLKSNGYKIIMWDVLSRDYNAKLSAEDCLRKVLKHTKGGSILVFHDSLKAKKNLKHTLPAVLEHFSQKGYSFEKLS